MTRHLAAKAFFLLSFSACGGSGSETPPPIQPLPKDLVQTESPSHDQPDAEPPTPDDNP